MAKILNFRFRDKYYQVNEEGHIKANGLTYFSPDWIFLGGSRHHWNNRITVTREDAFLKPERLNGCLGRDKDHGTVRLWRGRYAGRLPRITNVYVEERR